MLRSRLRTTILVVAALTALVGGPMTMTAQAATAANSTTPGGQWWAVDSVAPASASTLASVKAYYNGGIPSAWGQYVSGPNGDVLTRTIVAFAHQNNMYLFMIAGDFTGNDASTSAASTDAAKAIAGAKAAGYGASSGALIIKDFEPTTNVTQAYMQTWTSAVQNSGYRVGFYGNPDTGAFPSAYCAALPSLSNVMLYSAQPEPAFNSASGAQSPSNAPAYAPDKPSCAASTTTTIWQYGEPGTNPANPVDLDEVQPGTAGLLAPDGSVVNGGSGTPAGGGLAGYVYELHSDGSVYEHAEGAGNCTSTTVCSGWIQVDGVGSGDTFVAGTGKYAYAVHSDGSVFERPQGQGACTSSSACTGWTQIDEATGGDVGVSGSSAYAYALHKDGSVFERPQSSSSCTSSTTCTGWTQVDNVGSGDTKISASGSYVFALHSDGSVFERPEAQGSCSSASVCTGWIQVDGAGSGDVGVAASSSFLYALHKDGSVFERPHGTGVCSSASSCTGWIQLDGVGSDIGIGASNGFAYALHKDGSVFARPQGSGACSSVTTCTGWTQIDAVGSGRVMVS